MTSCLLDASRRPRPVEPDDLEIERDSRTSATPAAVRGTSWTAVLGTAWTLSASAGLARKGTGPFDATVLR